MTVQIPDEFKDLLEKPICVHLATLMPNNQPQLSVVWCSYDGEHVLVNTARERQKAKNMLARSMATLLAVDPENPYRYLEIRGSVEITEEGAIELANQLAQAYAGKPTYYGGVAPAEMADQETRITCKITPTRVRTFNPGGE